MDNGTFEVLLCPNAVHMKRELGSRKSSISEESCKRERTPFSFIECFRRSFTRHDCSSELLKLEVRISQNCDYADIRGLRRSTAATRISVYTERTNDPLPLNAHARTPLLLAAHRGIRISPGVYARSPHAHVRRAIARLCRSRASLRAPAADRARLATGRIRFIRYTCPRTRDIYAGGER